MTDVIFEYKESACCNFLDRNTDGFEISIKKKEQLFTESWVLMIIL